MYPKNVEILNRELPKIKKNYLSLTGVVGVVQDSQNKFKMKCGSFVEVVDEILSYLDNRDNSHYSFYDDRYLIIDDVDRPAEVYAIPNRYYDDDHYVPLTDDERAFIESIKDVVNEILDGTTCLGARLHVDLEASAA